MKIPEILYVDTLPATGINTQLAVVAKTNQFFRYIENAWIEIFPTRNIRL